MIHNIIVQLCVFVLAVIIAGIKSLDLRLRPPFEQNQIEDAGDSATARQMTALLHVQQILQSNLLILNLFLLALLASANYGLFQIVAFAFLWLIAVHLLAATKSVQTRAESFTQRHMTGLLQLAAGLQPALSVLDDSRLLVTKRSNRFYTRGELLEAIMESKTILTKDEKMQIQAILDEPTRQVETVV